MIWGRSALAGHFGRSSQRIASSLQGVELRASDVKVIYLLEVPISF